MSTRKRALTGVIITLTLVCALLVTGVLSTRPAPRRAQAPALEVAPTIGQYTTVVDGQRFSYCGNGDLQTDPRAYDRVVFAIHGNDRRACGVAGAILASARMQETASRTLIIAPWFAMAKDVVAPEQRLHWSFYGWSQGDPSINPGPQLSSFEVMDRLAAQVTKPRTLAGFSGGAQFTARYSAATTVPFERVVIADPSTYLYFTPQRPGIDTAELARCPQYDRYRYGLENLNPYMASVGPRQLTERFLAQNTTYLLGEKDSDPRSLSLDKTCAAMVQGLNRLDRGERYYAYLKQVFGSRLHHTLRRVPDVDHDPVAMFTSDIGRQTLFPTPGATSATWPRWLVEQETR